MFHVSYFSEMRHVFNSLSLGLDTKGRQHMTHNTDQPIHHTEMIARYHQPIYSTLVATFMLLMFGGSFVITVFLDTGIFGRIIVPPIVIFVFYNLWTDLFNSQEIWAYQNRLVLYQGRFPIPRFLRWRRDTLDIPIDEIKEADYFSLDLAGKMRPATRLALRPMALPRLDPARKKIWPQAHWSR